MMMRRAIIASAALASLAACDQTRYVEAPPAQYQQKLGPASIVIEPGKSVRCLVAGKGVVEADACTNVATGITRMGNPCLFPGEIVAEALCHDVVGHQINLWPAGHPAS